MSDEEISRMAQQFAAAVSGPISAMIEAQHAPLIAEIKRRNSGVSRKQFQAFVMSQSLFRNSISDNSQDQKL